MGYTKEEKRIAANIANQKCRATNPGKWRKINRANSSRITKESSKNLTDYHIKKVLHIQTGLSFNSFTPELINLKRLLISTGRRIRNIEKQ